MELEDDFYAYVDNLHAFPNYTFLTDDEYEQYDEMDKPLPSVNLTVAKRHPFLWMKYACGMPPYDYQWKMLDAMYRKKRVVAVTSRQVGKSTMLAGFAFWAARNNIKPSGLDNRTHIAIVSKTERQAKNLLKEIHKMIQKADANYAAMTQGTKAYEKKKFHDEMLDKPTQFKIEFKGGTIQCWPPTGSIRGETLSFLFLDEADFLNHEDPDYFFYSEALPTLKKTDGNCFLFSTPKGLPGFFMDIVNPHDDKPADGWVRIWYPWTIHEDDWATGWQTRKDYLNRGKEIDFKVEYEASFTSGRHSFFHPDSIDAAVKKELTPEYDFHLPVTAGLDFGDTHSRTVLTLVYYDNERNTPQLIWDKEFQAGYENSNLPYFMRTIQNRYNIKEIVADDCVGGKSAIELLRRDGWNVKLFQFRSQKHEYYEYTRTAFSNGRIELYRNPDLLAQLKSIEEKVTPKGNVQISKTRGMNDDRCDSLVMALSPYTPPKPAGKRYVL